MGFGAKPQSSSQSFPQNRSNRVERTREITLFCVNERQENVCPVVIMDAMTEGQIFLMDVLLDGAMLLLALRFAALPVRWKGVVIASLLGAGTAFAAKGLPDAVRMLLWMPTALGMVAIAGGRRAAQRPFRSAMLLLCAAGLLGGTILALGGALGSKTAGLLLGTFAVFALAAAANHAHRAGQAASFLRVTLRYGGREICLDALVDSGNCLRDYLTQKPMIVAPEEGVRRRLGLEEKALRPIFADTAGGRQMMWCLTPDEIRITEGEKERMVCAMLALSPGLRGNAPALFPASLLQGNGQEGA